MALTVFSRCFTPAASLDIMILLAKSEKLQILYVELLKDPAYFIIWKLMGTNILFKISIFYLIALIIYSAELKAMVKYVKNRFINILSSITVES